MIHLKFTRYRTCSYDQVSFNEDLEVAAVSAVLAEAITTSPEGNNGVSVTTVHAVVIDETEWDHGTVQPDTGICRDWFWALLFMLQLGTVVTLAILGVRNMIHHMGYVQSKDSLLLSVCVCVYHFNFISFLLLLLCHLKSTCTYLLRTILLYYVKICLATRE